MRVKGDPEEAIEELKSISEAFGLTVEAAADYAQVEFKAGDNEILIGFTPTNDELLAPITPFLINPTFAKGDGSEDLSIGFSINFATTISEMLDDEPFYEHLLSGFSTKLTGRTYAKSREIFQKIIVAQWEKIEQLAHKVPILGPLLLFK